MQKVKAVLTNKWVTPFVALFIALGASILLIAPMVYMNPRDIPIALVNFDEGAKTPQGELNAGAIFIAGIKDKTKDNNLIQWQTVDSQDMLDQGLDPGDFYAVLIIPDDFTVSQLAVEMGKGEASPVKLIINQGKNPMVAGSLENSFNSIIDSSSLDIQKEFINPVSSNLGLLASFLPMVFMILVYISSYASAVIIRRSFNLNNKNRGQTILIQLGMSAIVALCICFIATPVVSNMIDLDISLVDMALFMSLASFALITIVIGSLNWFGMVGMAVPVLLLVLGLGTADLPYEFLPGFWQSMVYPWMPLRFIADGARAILYQGVGFWNISFGALAIAAVVGIFIMSTSIITPLHKVNKTT